MEYNAIDIKNTSDELLRTLAIWHNETPRLWLNDYNPSEEDILATINRLKNGNHYVCVACEETIVGFIWAEKHEDHVMILSLYISPEYRQLNIATELKKALEVWCVDKKIFKIKTTVHSKNKKMLQLNEKMGYESKMISMEKKLRKDV